MMSFMSSFDMSIRRVRVIMMRSGRGRGRGRGAEWGKKRGRNMKFNEYVILAIT